MPPSVWRIVEDDQGDLWIATMNNGVFRYNKQSGHFKQYLHDENDPYSINHNTVWSVYFAPQAKELWLATHAGAARYDAQQDRFIRYPFDPQNLAGVSHEWVQEILEDSRGTLWIGTQGGGLNRYERNRDSFTRIQQVDGLASDQVSGHCRRRTRAPLGFQ